MTIHLTPKPPLSGSWSERRARTATLARLNRIANLWAEIALLWSDVDCGLETEADEQIVELRKREQELLAHWSEMDAEHRS